MFKELNIINSYTLEASFFKSDHKAMMKIKAEYEFSQQGSSNVASRRNTANNSFEEIDDHFEQIDFINIGKDFAKSISIGASNPVLKKIFFPILFISPMTKEEENKLKTRVKNNKRMKHKSVTRENSMPSSNTCKLMRYK